MKSMTVAGRRLGDRLRGLAPEVMTALAGEARTVQLFYSGYQAALMSRLPWEMVYDGDEAPAFEKVPLEGFWGGRHVIERPLIPQAKARLELPPPLPTTLSTVDLPRVGLVLDWGIDAGPALDLFGRWVKEGLVRLQPIEEAADLYQSLKDPADLYVFYGRGRQEVGESVIGIGKGYSLRSRELLNRVMRGRIAKRPLKDMAAQVLQDPPTAVARVLERPAIDVQGRLVKGPLFYFCLHGDPAQEVADLHARRVAAPTGAAFL
jgi:hypothetical protein